MRALLKAAALAAVVALSFTPVLAPVAALAQATVSSVSSIAIPTPADTSTVVTIPLGDWSTQVLDLAGSLLMAAAAALVAVGVRFLPGWLQPLVTASVQAAIANFIRQGFASAIQQVEDFDKGKTVTFDVGSAAVATALTYVIEHAPPYLVNLAGGRDAIVQKIIAFLDEHGIVLGTGVQPGQVAAAALKAS